MTVKGDPASAEDVMRAQEDIVLPALRGCTGFKAQLLLLDRARGEAIGISLWDTEQNLAFLGATTFNMAIFPWCPRGESDQTSDAWFGFGSASGCD